MPKKKINIKLNGKTIKCNEGETIRHVAKDNGINIPGLCAHSDFEMKGNCRICVVEVKGMNKLVTSCSTVVAEGMEIKTESPRVEKARNMNIELIFAEHIEKCADCIWRFQCRLLSFAEKYKILITHFRDRKASRKTYKFANAVELDGSQCIDCRNCVDACALIQDLHCLEIKGKGIDQEIVPAKDKHCILCGQCAVHCPVSAAQEQAHWDVVEEILNDKKGRILVAQFAPSIRVSIGEDFGLPYGEVVTENIVAGLRELGFDYVFDVNFGADITTMVEAEELVERLTKGGTLPMMTSCCPGWVNFVEHYHPELIPNLTTSRSPHIHNGGAIKTYWAKKFNIDVDKIVVISVMPCTAKKFEASREEMKIGKNWPVDYVITTREFSFMMKKNKIDFAKIKKSKADNPLGEYSGAGAIYGASGGVMESALRTANYMICSSSDNKLCETRIDFKDVRGHDGIKEAEVDIDGTKLKVAVVNEIGNVKKVIPNLSKYHYVEVMACPGGCIGGGGQPIPTTPEIRQKRIDALYVHDKSLKMRTAHANEGVAKILEWLHQDHKLAHSVLHTKYKKRASWKKK